MRATMSLAAPAANGLTTRIERTGQSWAAVPPMAQAAPSKVAAARTNAGLERMVSRAMAGILIRMPRAGQPGTVPDVACHRRHTAAPKLRPSASRLDARAGARVIRSAVPGTDVSGANRAPGKLRAGRGADFDAAFDQDRRLPGGLRLLPAERALRYRRARRKADCARG